MDQAQNVRRIGAKNIVEELEQEKKWADDKLKDFIKLCLKVRYLIDPFFTELDQITLIQTKIVAYLDAYGYNRVEEHRSLDEFISSREAMDRRWKQLDRFIQTGEFDFKVLFKMYRELNVAISNLSAKLNSEYERCVHKP